jgi:hypothetical protein
MPDRIGAVSGATWSVYVLLSASDHIRSLVAARRDPGQLLILRHRPSAKKLVATSSFALGLSWLRLTAVQSMYSYAR